MPLSAGDRIGPYVVVARIGAGGMGDVYRARDTRLDRTVALKVLSPDLAGDAQFRERFTREARAVAALTHPHICTVYDVGETTVDDASSRPIQFLAMEYLEGESLATRLSRGPLPLGEALPIAVQLARALDRAHRAGIIHRDLKPANVMLTKGTAKLLDFGLAKYMPGMGPGDLTSAGVVLGTLQYMAPEQLTGQPVDARTDIFAFGAVLYEMLTGKRSVVAASAATGATAVTEPAPQLSGVQPPALDRAVRKCLAVDPDDRWQSAADLAAELEWIADGSGAVATTGIAPRSGGRMRERLAWGFAALFGLTAVAIAFRLNSSSVAPATPKRFVVPLPDMQHAVGGTRTFALLPDASGIAYLAGDTSTWRIHLYSFAEAASRALAGTERAMFPTVSPDGRWIAFYRAQRVMKVALAGGPPMEICEAASPRGLSWGTDDWIIIGIPSGLVRVPAAGGQPQPLTTLEAGELRHVLPHALPGGKAVLFTVIGQTGTIEDAALTAVTVATRQRQVVLKGAFDGRYVPSGHLLYARQSDLMAVSFDPDRLQMSGTPFLAAPAVRVTPQGLDGFFDVAGDGTLVSMGSELQRTLVWIDRKGVETPLPVPVRPYFHPSLLPDERNLIVEIEETPHNLWHLDLTSGALTLLTRESANHRAVASFDGRFIAFSSDRTKPRGLFRQATDGSGQPERLSVGATDQNVTAWSRDGRWLAFTQTAPATKSDIWVLRVDGGPASPQPVVQTPGDEQGAAFSPDGRWIAYGSYESGRRWEVMIAAFPGPGPRKQVSTNGGETPSFSLDGKKLYYRLDDRIWAVDLTTAPVLTAGVPAVAFTLPPTGAFAFTGLPNYVISRDGERVLAIKYLGGDKPPRDVNVTVNWFETLRRAAPAR